MKKRVVKKNITLAKILEYIGKPAFFLFTILTVSAFAYFHLLTLFVQYLSRFHLPSITFPHPQFRIPSIHFPKIQLSFVLLFLSPLFVIGSIGLLVYWFILYDLPHPSYLRHLEPSLSTKILARDGALLYKIYGTENRTIVELASLPSHLINATIAAEDKNFYSHPGLDLSGIIRALHNNLECQLLHSVCTSALQGGSTITQQLIKNTTLDNEKTLRRKLREAVLALWAERLYTKDQILEMYLNNIPYGGTSYGIEEAAVEYFGKSARDLDLSESALLAGLPVAPTSLSPFGTTPYMAKIRQRQVLERMVIADFITENDKVAAESIPLSFHPKGDGILAPHFVMYIKSLLVQSFGEGTVERGGLVVTTSLDLNKQALLEESIHQELGSLSALQVGNGAGMIISPRSGEILAMVGSRDFFDTKSDGQVNVTLMPRQPGSSIKPITYSLALMRGFTPSTLLQDEPVCFVIRGQPNYCPENYDGRFHGSVTLRTALASSYNVPAVKLLNSLGVDNLVTLGEQMGLTTWVDSSRFGLSLTLGAGEVTMYDLVQAYSVFANNGKKIPLTAILEVTDHLGKGLTLRCTSCQDNSVQAAEGDEVIPASVAYQISSILADPGARAPAFGTRSVLNIPGHTVSVKTGTTNSLRDNWTIGYTPDFLVATWVGNNDNSPMSRVASGITGASPIWSTVMRELVKDMPDTPLIPPESMIKVPICQTDRSYYCAAFCSTPPVYEYFVPGTAPRADCDRRGTIRLSPEERRD